MMIKGTIFDSLYKVPGNGQKNILRKDNHYYLVEEGDLKKIYSYDGEVSHSIYCCDGLWVVDKKNFTTYIDIFNTGKKFPIIPYRISRMRTYADRLVLNTNDITSQKLICIDLTSGNTNVLGFEKGLYFSLDKDHIYTRSNSGKLVECYNYQLEKIWQYTELEGRVYIDFERAPQIHNDLIIINHACDTIALNKKTGEEVWKYTFKDIPSSNLLTQGKIYAVCQAILYIINPNTGAVELSADTGYDATYQNNENKNQIGVFPIGDYLYATAMYHNAEPIKLFNHDASKLLYSCTFHDYYFNPYLSIQPEINNGKIFQPVRNINAFSENGIMVMEIMEGNDQADIYPVAKPDITLVANPSLSEPHKLQIYLDVDNLDDAIRYGELLTSEVQFATGYNPAYNIRESALDTKHNAHIELIIDDSIFSQDSGDILNKFEERLKELFLNGNYRAGDKKTPIFFKLVRQNKNDWKMVGDILDWPAIQNQITPIS